MKDGSMTVGAAARPDARAVMRGLCRGDCAGLRDFARREPEAWGRVCAELFESQIPTLFYSWLKRAGLESLVPSPLLEKVRQKYEATLAANILMQEQFLRIEAAMREAGIELTPLKGLELIEGVYDDIAARGMSDIDIFVSDSRRVEAIGVLRMNGYRCDFDGLVSRAENFNSGFLFYSDDPGQTHVELHWSVMDPAGVRMNMMTRRRSLSLSRLLADGRGEGRYGGRPVSMLAAGHSLLFMLLHIYSHNFEGEKWFWDIALFLDRKESEIDWEDFFRAVSRYRLEKIVHSVFLFVERSLGVPVAPEAVRRRFAGLPGAQRWVCEKISACERENVRLLLSLLLHTSVLRMLMTVARYFSPTRRQLEITACQRVRWRDYPRMFLKLRIGRMLHP
ncbi:MAG: nucleotidyltransferase family protein [bacterium]